LRPSTISDFLALSKMASTDNPRRPAQGRRTKP
jgi:hypothetical protein